MRAAILAVGDELICGYRLDTNSQAIAQRLSAISLDIVLHITAGDEVAAIQDALRTALTAAEVVVVTGGLGPTEDDLTRQAVAAFFGRPLVEDEEALARMRERFARRNVPMPERNRVQALVPAGSQVIQNDRGTAAGFYLTASGRHVFVVPGVPYEMMGMLEAFILPALRELTAGGFVVCRGVTRIFGVPESEVAERIQSMLGRERNPLLGLLPSRGTITVEVVAHGQSEAEAEALLAADQQALREIFGLQVLCQDERELSQVVGDLLSERGLTIAIVEGADGSGGAVAARLTEVPGSTAWFCGGQLICQSPPPDELPALASAIRQSSGSAVGLAVGALVQPDDAPPDRPYGVLTAALDLGGQLTVRSFSYSGERVRVRQFAVDAVLDMLRLALLRNAP